MGLINFFDIRKSYNNQEVLRGVSFTIEKGERVALIGPNGAGKTTLLRIAQGLETADSGSSSFAKGTIPGVLTQDLSHLGEDETALQWREVADIERKMRALEHEMAAEGADLGDLMRRYDRLTARYEAIDGYTVEARLKNILLGLGLREEALLTPLSLLSSGEKMRAGLARILLTQPDLLLLDEPTNHLDIAALKWLEDFLTHFDGGVLFVSHDRYFLNRVSTRVIELSGGTTVEHKGNYSSFVQQKAIRREHAQRENFRLEHEIARKKELITGAYHMRRHSTLHMYEKQLDRLEEEKRGLRQTKAEGHLDYGRSATIRLRQDVHMSARIAEAVDASKAFGERVLFKDVNFLVRGGDRVGIIGANGCGKTTLLRMLLGQDTDFSGVCALGEWVQYVFLDQNAAFEDERRTLIGEVTAAKEMDEAAARKALARVGLYGEECDKTISVLSGGERVRLKLCLAMLGEPHCLILDEPTNHLDLPAREAVEKALVGFSGSVVAVSHDRYFLNACVNKLFIMENQRLEVFIGNWDAYQASKEVTAKREAARTAPRRAAQTKRAMPEDEDAMPLLEADIAALEQAKAELESRFGPDAERGVYEEYARADAELEGLYERWAALSGEGDA